MANCRWYSISPSVEEVENSVQEDGGILNTTGFGFDCPESPENPEVGGWEIRLVDKRGMGNHGSFIAVATTPETLKLQKRATMRLLREEADAMEARAALPDSDGLPYPDWGTGEDGYMAEQNRLELLARQSFHERGDFACMIVPMLDSPLFPKKGCFLFADEKWAYFAHPNANFLRVGDGRHRLWVRPARKR